MQWQDVVEIALKWPEVAEDISYGEPSLRVRKRLLTRTRIEDGTIVLLDVPPEERDMLIEASPQSFFIEDHYRNHDIVLARLERIYPSEVEALLERRWRNSATKRAITMFDRGML